MSRVSPFAGTIEVEAKMLYRVEGRVVSDAPLSKADHAAAWVEWYRQEHPDAEWPMVKNVVQGVYDRFILRISENTAWRGLQKVMEAKK